MPAGLMSRSSSDEIWQFEVLSGCKNRDKNSSWHNLSFALSREFWFCLLLQIAQIGTYEPIFSYMVAFTLDKLQIYYPCDQTTTLIPKTSETSPVSLAFFYCLTFSLVPWLLTSTSMFLKVFRCLEHTNNCYIFFHIVVKLTGTKQNQLVIEDFAG